MTSRSHLGWPVTESVWQTHVERVREEWGAKKLYAGIEAERIVKLWVRIEETNAADLDRPTGDPPNTKKKKEQNGRSDPDEQDAPDTSTRLEDQPKDYVQVQFSDDVADTVDAYADQYDVYNGVMLAYMLREYYDTDGWGYSRHAVGSGDDSDDEIPYRESEKVEWIADRLRERMDAAGRKKVYAREIREVVEQAGAASRVDHYRDAALDNLGYVHHPENDGVYISIHARWDEYGVGDDDPAIYRKPYAALTREEKIEGIKAVLSTRGVAMPVKRIHQKVFDGNGSTQHIRDLVHTVAEQDCATYRPSAGGTKLLRVEPCGYPREPECRSQDDESAAEPDETEQDSNTSDALANAEGPTMDELMEAEQVRTDGGRPEP